MILTFRSHVFRIWVIIDFCLFDVMIVIETKKTMSQELFY